MSSRLADQLQQVQKDLARSIAAAEQIGESLVELGTRLRREPSRWTIDWLDDSFPASGSGSGAGSGTGSGDTNLIERPLVEALDRNRLEWLLEDIRILQRRAVELRRLLEDQPLYETAAG